MLLLAFLSCVRRQVLTTSVRQAMMFFIVGLALGFVLPLGRDVLNCLGVHTYWGWTRICAEVVMHSRSVKLDIQLLLHMYHNLIATQWTKFCMLLLAFICMMVTSIFRDSHKPYARRSRKRRFGHARRPDNLSPKGWLYIVLIVGILTL